MKVVRIKFKKGVKKPIKESQKSYYYLCPVKNIQEGDFVLVDSHRGRDFSVAKIEAVYDRKPKDVSTVLDSFVICILPVKDFNGRCIDVHYRKLKITTKVNQAKKKREK